VSVTRLRNDVNSFSLDVSVVADIVFLHTAQLLQFTKRFKNPYICSPLRQSNSQ